MLNAFCVRSRMLFESKVGEEKGYRVGKCESSIEKVKITLACGNSQHSNSVWGGMRFLFICFMMARVCKRATTTPSPQQRKLLWLGDADNKISRKRLVYAQQEASVANETTNQHEASLIHLGVTLSASLLRLALIDCFQKTPSLIYKTGSLRPSCSFSLCRRISFKLQQPFRPPSDHTATFLKTFTCPHNITSYALSTYHSCSVYNSERLPTRFLLYEQVSMSFLLWTLFFLFVSGLSSPSKYD